MAYAFVVLSLLVLAVDEFTSSSSIGGGFMMSSGRRQQLAAKVRLRQRLRPAFYVAALVAISLVFFTQGP